MWKLGLSLLVNVSWKMLVLEAWILSECLARVTCQECPECPARVFSKGVLSRVSSKSV